VIAEGAAKETQQGDAAVLDTLAAAQAANGRAADAVQTQERALALWRERRVVDEIARAERRLAAYRRAVEHAGDGV
jgi:hypothetical protein